MTGKDANYPGFSGNPEIVNYCPRRELGVMKKVPPFQQSDHSLQQQSNFKRLVEVTSSHTESQRHACPPPLS